MINICVRDVFLCHLTRALLHTSATCFTFLSCVAAETTVNIFITLIRRMKLITHNMLTSKGIKNVKEGFPLKIQADEVRNVDIDFDREFISRMVPKLDWNALTFAAQCVGHQEDLPETLPEGYEDDDELLKKLHHILLEVEVINGCLECPETQRKFPISNGIPNMLLNEDEV